MAANVSGARLRAARALGITLFEYLHRLARGEKHCQRCRAWHKKKAFGSDASRYDGLDTSCRRSKNARQKLNYQKEVARG